MRDDNTMDLLVISSFPERGSTHSKKTVGVASYTKILLVALKKSYPILRIRVLAEIFEKPNDYEEDGLTIHRVWNRSSLKSIPTLFISIIRHKSKPLLIALESYMIGSPFYTLLFLITLLLARMLGSNSVILMHQVVKDFRQLEKNPIKATLLNIANTIFNTLVLWSNKKIIVFEEEFRSYLNNNKKVIVIPHFVPEVPMISKEAACKKLNLNQKVSYCLYFGFLAPYKGIDLLIDAWPARTTTLLIAGGPNPNHIRNHSLQRFADMIKTKAKNKNIHVTGFVPEDKFYDYFAAADVVIFPYRSFISSSGPLSFAIAFQKPFLLSKPLMGYQKSLDITQAFLSNNISLNQLGFMFDSQDITKKLAFVMKNARQLQRIERLIQHERKLPIIAQKLYNVIKSL